jgi:hypothetical protein
VELSTKARAPGAPLDARPADAPPLVPTEPATEAAIDRAHLARMTHAEPDLEREVLGLFATQTELLLGRIRGASPAAAGALAHTLCGSARGIGAWKVAEAAAAVEAEVVAGRNAAAAVERLEAAAQEAQVEIVDLLRD